nr:ras association domain-containing protein 6 isoform X1 [Solea senegalensis]
MRPAGQLMKTEMNAAALRPVIRAGDGRTLSRAEFLSLLNTYNCFLKDQTQLHLGFCQAADGEVVVEGFLNICWGVRRPIRLKIQDDKQMLPFVPAIVPLIPPDPAGPLSPVSPLENKRGMTRWGEYADLHQIDEISETAQETAVACPLPGPVVYETTTLRPVRQKNAELEDESNLFRCMSDASLVKRRGRGKTAAQREKERQHRFSINGHFYNYKTSIFTPSFGTATKVRISSRMNTNQVIEELLNKFKIENDPQEFSLYCVHQSGEKKKLGNRDQPLWERILQGPSDDIMKIFLMDMDEREVSNDVAQYLNLELPILEQILLKLREEEHREIQRVVEKYHKQHRLLSRMMSSKVLPHIETSV